jgi:hypothetical protein
MFGEPKFVAAVTAVSMFTVLSALNQTVGLPLYGLTESHWFVQRSLQPSGLRPCTSCRLRMRGASAHVRIPSVLEQVSH